MKKATTLNEALVILATKLNYVSAESRVLKADNGAELHLDTELHGTSYSFTPCIQVVLSLVTNGRRMWWWGSQSSEENEQIIDWFLALKSGVRRDADDAQETASKELLKTLGL